MKRLFSLVVITAFMSYFPAALSLYRMHYLAVAIALVFALVLVAQGAAKRHLLLKDTRFVLFLYAYLLLTALWALDPIHTMTWVAIEMLNVAIFMVAYLWAGSTSLEGISNLFRITPYIVLPLFVYLYLTYGMLRPDSYETEKAFGAIANIAASWLVVSLPIMIWRVREKVGNGGKFEIGLTLVLIMVSQSRAALLLGILALIIPQFVYSKNFGVLLKNLTLMMLGLVAVAGVILAVPLTRNMLLEGFSRLAATSANSYSDRERLIMLISGWKAFLKRPLIGIGYMNLGVMVKKVIGKEEISHNIFITFISEAGWAGFFIFCALLRHFYKRNGSAMRATASDRERRFIASIGISFGLAVSVGLFFPLMQLTVFWVLLGTGFVMYRVYPPRPAAIAIPAAA